MGLAILAGTVVAVVLLSRWMKHRADEADAVCPPEQGGDPPIFDAGRFMNH